jgi:hypothetical protein
MAKRSNFPRRKADAYQTFDPAAVRTLWPHLKRARIRTFAEPCCGEGHLVRSLVRMGLTCVCASDITSEPDGTDALKITKFINHADAVITNPPWTRALLHPMIMHFQKLAPCVWLLFDADWAFNKAAGPYLDQCSDIVAVGRIRWIEGTTQTGKDNVAWYRFDTRHSGGPKFHGRNK